MPAVNSPIVIGLLAFAALALLAGLAWLAVTAPARIARRRHVNMLIRSSEEQVFYGFNADGSPRWPCGPKAVNATETGFCRRAPDHDGEHAGLISSPGIPDREGTWPTYNPQPWREEPRA